MAPEQRTDAVLQLPHPEAHNETAINELIGYMVDLKNIDFEEVLNDYILQHGVEKTLTTIVFAFLEKVGMLWQTNKITPAQEHIISNIVRQKIVSAIEDLPFVRKAAPLFLLMLPENEHHEMGLLFVYYLLRKNSIPVIYLGANVPLKDVTYLVKIKKPAFLYLHITTFPRQLSFQKYISSLSLQAPDSNILISGAIAQKQKNLPHSNIQYLQSFAEVVLYIDNFDKVSNV